MSVHEGPEIGSSQDRPWGSGSSEVVTQTREVHGAEAGEQTPPDDPSSEAKSFSVWIKEMPSSAKYVASGLIGAAAVSLVFWGGSQMSRGEIEDAREASDPAASVDGNEGLDASGSRERDSVNTAPTPEAEQEVVVEDTTEEIVEHENQFRPPLLHETVEYSDGTVVEREYTNPYYYEETTTSPDGEETTDTHMELSGNMLFPDDHEYVEAYTELSHQEFLETIPNPEANPDDYTLTEFVEQILRRENYAFCNPEGNKDGRYLEFIHGAGYGSSDKFQSNMEYIADPETTESCLNRYEFHETRLLSGNVTSDTFTVTLEGLAGDSPTGLIEVEFKEYDSEIGKIFKRESGTILEE